MFDEANLVSAAGLVPVLRLAESAGMHELLREHLSVGSPNAVAKAGSVVGGMLAGADSIDDLDLLRHGGMRRVFNGVRAPSTLGTFLRSFTHGHVQQLDAVAARLLAGLAARVPELLGPELLGPELLGPAGSAGTGPAAARSRRSGPAEGLVFVDVDDTVREVHGYAKQAAAYGYSRVRGLNVQLATVSTATSAPVIARARLRRGNVASATGVGRLLAQAITTVHACDHTRRAGPGVGPGVGQAAGSRRQVLARADSAYFGHAFVASALRQGAWFSVTARMVAPVTAAISSIDEAAWTPIRYPQAVFEETEQRWVSDAEVAEVPYIAFTSRRKADHVPCRLVVRRVRRLQPRAGDGTTQGELFAAHRHHAFITNSTLPMVEADEHHRDHALVEQVIAELKDGPLAHLPSGTYTANAAWVSLAVLAFNLARAAAVAAGHAKARWATVRTRIINVPARVATSGRRTTLHLPKDWKWERAWTDLHDTARATGPPAPRTP